MNHQVDLSIIIVNWKSRDYLRVCLGSILMPVPGIDFEVVVIDSGSFDGCGQMLAENYPYVRFIQSDKNLGFAGANNRAFLESTGECILFLNPDTELTGPAIQTLYDELNTLPDCGMVGGRLLNTDGSLQASCIQAMPTVLNRMFDSAFLRRLWPKSSLWGMAPLFAETHEPCEVEAISGACLMIKRRIFELVGMFSDDYFMYAEDVDLCYKVRMAGLKNYFVPDVRVLHHGGSSSGQATNQFSAVMAREATWRFFRKTRGKFYASCYRMAMMASAAVRLGLLGVGLLLQPRARVRDRWTHSVSRCLAVLRWAFGRDELVKQYYSK